MGTIKRLSFDLDGTLLAPKAMQLEELPDAIPSEWEKQRKALLSGLRLRA